MWSPSVTHKHSSYNTYTKTATLSFESNFPTGTTISSIKLSNGKEIPAGNITSAPCESDNSKMCITATIQLEANECVKVKAEIFYTNPYDTISKIGYYKAIDNPSKYQDMYVFDRNAKASVMVTKKPEQTTMLQLKNLIYVHLIILVVLLLAENIYVKMVVNVLKKDLVKNAKNLQIIHIVLNLNLKKICQMTVKTQLLVE